MSAPRMARMNRRTLLRGAGGAALALPWLEAMGLPGARVAHAAGAFPKRLIVFFTPNGTIRGNWTPTGTETSFTLPRILEPLKPHQQDLVVIDGLDNTAARTGSGDGHQKGMGGNLTGRPLLDPKEGTRYTPRAGLASGPSVDQEIVARTKPDTKFGSLELGVQVFGYEGSVWYYVNYKAADQPLAADSNPASVFKRVFSEVSATPGAPSMAAAGDAARLDMERRAVMDAVLDSYKSLSAKVGAADRMKLDAHATAVSEIQKAIFQPAASVAKSCTRPGEPTIDPRANDNFPMIGKIQMDLLVSAMQCELTNVGTIQWTRSFSDPRFTWIGINRGHHEISHEPDGNAMAQEQLTKIDTWYAGQLAYLIGKLKAIPEGTGTMLDNTLIVWCNEVGKGNAHSHNELPFVLAGRAGGAIRTGRFLKANGPHNQLLISILNAFGVPATSFGSVQATALPGLVSG